MDNHPTQAAMAIELKSGDSGRTSGCWNFYGISYQSDYCYGCWRKLKMEAFINSVWNMSDNEFRVLLIIILGFVIVYKKLC